MAMIENEKIFVTVNADFTLDGIVVPRAIIRKDGRIDEIEDISGTYPLSDKDPGVNGTCYICWVKGKRILLNFGEGRWYEEERGQAPKKC